VRLGFLLAHIYKSFAQNYLGHSKTSTNNLYVYPNAQPREIGLWNMTSWAGYQGIHYPICASSEGNIAEGADRSGFNETWSDNRCLLAAAADTATVGISSRSNNRRRKVPRADDSKNLLKSSGEPTGPSVYYYDSCDNSSPDQLRATTDLTFNNSFYAPNRSISIHCGATGEGIVWTLQKYQQLGQEEGSSVHEPPTTEAVLQWAKEMVWLS
jgi:hypothetical protein